MAAAPERTIRVALPWLPLPAILGFSLFGVGGSIFLAYTTFRFDTPKQTAAPSNDVPVYEARAVPFDSPRETPAERAASIARVLTATQTERRAAEATERAEPGENAAASNPVFVSAENRELRGFDRFASFASGSNYLAVTGSNSVGISAQTAPSGFFAPDAETASAASVPEASTWICGGALFLLVAGRGMHASRHRKRRRMQ